MTEESALRQIQLQELELLLMFRQMCEENHLTYYLTGGSLLGAVRHKGFIPWDDDIDVAMPRKDYDRFAQLCARSLGAEYCYRNERTAFNYPHFFSKLAYAAGSGKSERAYIDIFPLDVCPDKDAAAVAFFKTLAIVTSAIMDKVTDDFVCGYTKKYAIVLWKILRRFPLRLLYAMRHGIRKGFGLLGSGKQVCNVGGLYSFPGEVHQKEWFSEFTELSFEGHLFSVPADWDGLLRNMYGQYMVLPPESERFGHKL